MAGDLSLGQLLLFLGSSGVCGVVGVLLAGRSGKQRAFESRVDARNAKLEARNEELEQLNNTQAEEITRLRMLLWSKRTDPDSPLEEPEAPP